MAADATGPAVQGIDTEAAAALGRALLSKVAPGELGALGPAAAFVAGMWPKPTAGPELDAAPPVHDVPDPENGVARSEDSDGPVGAELDESRRHDKRSKSQIKAAEAAAKASAAGGASAPPPDPNDDDKPVFKRPNEKFKFNDRMDLNRFTKHIKTSDAPFKEDPETGYRIQEDETTHGGRKWKLFNRRGRRVGSFSEDGRYLGK